MKESRVDKMIQALATPDLEAHRRMRQQQQAQEDRRLIEGRKVAGLALLGAATGAVVAHYGGQRVIGGGLWSAIAASTMRRLWVGWRNHQR